MRGAGLGGEGSSGWGKELGMRGIELGMRGKGAWDGEREIGMGKGSPG